MRAIHREIRLYPANIGLIGNRCYNRYGRDKNFSLPTLELQRWEPAPRAILKSTNHKNAFAPTTQAAYLTSHSLNPNTHFLIKHSQNIMAPTRPEKDAKQQKPADAGLLIALAVTKLEEGDLETAFGAAQQVLDASGDNGEHELLALNILGQICVEAGEVDDARACFERGRAG